MDTLRLIGSSLLIMLVILNYFVGMHPLMETMYDYHLWPRPGVQEIRHVVMRGTRYNSMSCRPGENGWDYICDATSSDRTGKTTQFRLGVMAGAYPVVRQATQLPLDGPIPAREEYRAKQAAEHERQQK
jgi:hypothetical protein